MHLTLVPCEKGRGRLVPPLGGHDFLGAGRSPTLQTPQQASRMPSVFPARCNSWRPVTPAATMAPMYRKILVALENSKADKTLLPHITDLAKRLGSHLLLVHVADGWAARNFDKLKLAEAEEMRADRRYLEEAAARLRGEGLSVTAHLALGNRPAEILKTAMSQQCDLIAMTSHGHRLLGDLIFGSTINEVRHKTYIPILVVRAGSTA